MTATDRRVDPMLVAVGGIVFMWAVNCVAFGLTLDRVGALAASVGWFSAQVRLPRG